MMLLVLLELPSHTQGVHFSEKGVDFLKNGGAVLKNLVDFFPKVNAAWGTLMVAPLVA